MTSCDQGRGLSTNILAAFVDGNGASIVVELIYWSESELVNRLRVEETLRTLGVTAPLAEGRVRSGPLAGYGLVAIFPHQPRTNPRIPKLIGTP